MRSARLATLLGSTALPFASVSLRARTFSVRSHKSRTALRGPNVGSHWVMAFAKKKVGAASAFTTSLVPSIFSPRMACITPSPPNV